MRWTTFAIFAYVALMLQVGFGAVRIWPGVAPSLLWILAVFIAMWAAPMPAFWAAMILGLLIDLQPVAVGEAYDVAAIVGPHAVGFVIGAYAVTVVRGVFYRDSALAFGVMVLLAGIVSQLVVVAILAARGLPWSAGESLPNWSAAEQLFERFFVLLYSAVLAVLIGRPLKRFVDLWGFDSGKSASGARRR